MYSLIHRAYVGFWQSISGINQSYNQNETTAALAVIVVNVRSDIFVGDIDRMCTIQSRLVEFWSFGLYFYWSGSTDSDTIVDWA